MGIEFFEDWSQVRQLPVEERFFLDQALPEKNLIQNRKYLNRYREKDIPKKQWDQIHDPDRPDSYSKSNFVKSYFTVCVFSVERLRQITVSANSSREINEQISQSSSLRESVTETMRLESVLHSEASGSSEGGLGGSVSATITASYDIVNMKEYCLETSRVYTVNEHYSEVPYDRDVVIWNFVKTVAVYREDTDGGVELIGLGDFLVTTKNKTYAEEEQKNGETNI